MERSDTGYRMMRDLLCSLGFGVWICSFVRWDIDGDWNTRWRMEEGGWDRYGDDKQV